MRSQTRARLMYGLIVTPPCPMRVFGLEGFGLRRGKYCCRNTRVTLESFSGLSTPSFTDGVLMLTFASRRNMHTIRLGEAVLDVRIQGPEVSGRD